MARARSLKPELFRDKLMGRLGSQVVTVYEALWCWSDDGADDEGGVGVCRIEPDVLKGECFMRWPEYTTGVLTECLVRLQGAGRIVPFEVGGELYAELPKLGRHGKINNPSKFRYPRGGPRVTDIRGWLSGQYTQVVLPESSRSSIQYPDTSFQKPKIQKAGAAENAAPVIGSIEHDEPVAAWYGRVLRPLLYVQPNPSASAERENQSRDISVLKRQLAGRPRGDVEDAVREARAQAQAGQLTGWIERDETFTLRALLAEANGGIATFERFRHAALKRRESGEAA